jgi:ribosomal-protein-alanine N-acetyltransferase
MLVAETHRLVLRHLRPADGDALDRVFGDAEVMRFGDGPRPPAWVRQWIVDCVEHRYRQWGFGMWAVVEKAGGRCIGYCGLSRFHGRCGPDETEVGYRLARAFWGRGFATEAVRATCQYATSPLGLRRLIAIIDPGNRASIHVAEKAGFRYERDLMLEGYAYPDHVYALVAPATVADGPCRSR